MEEFIRHSAPISTLRFVVISQLSFALNILFHTKREAISPTLIGRFDMLGCQIQMWDAASHYMNIVLVILLVYKLGR